MMIVFTRKTLKSAGIPTLLIYSAVALASMLHVHPAHIVCEDDLIRIEAPACCHDHHGSAECSLCEFIQASKTGKTQSFHYSLPVISKSFSLSHQTNARQVCFGDAPSRAPPVC